MRRRRLPIDELLSPDRRRARSRTWSSARAGRLGAVRRRFRENAARALLLPRRRGEQRTPLWQMRQRAADLLAVASRYGSFPIMLETYRECLQDVFDLPALQDVLRGIEQRQIRVRQRRDRARASPFARSLLFDYIAEYMYEGDAPLAERRAQALALDRDLLRELLGAGRAARAARRRRAGRARARAAVADGRARGRLRDQVHDLLRRLGDLTADEVAARVRGVDDERDARGGDGSRRWRPNGGRSSPHRRRGALDRHRGRGPLPRRGRRAAAARRARGFLAPTPDALGGLLPRWARHARPVPGHASPRARWGLPRGPW